MKPSRWLLTGFLAALCLGAGYADIDSTSPAGSDAANTIDDQIRDLKADLLVGVAIEHDDGQTTAAHQGYHAFSAGNTASIPASANRPDGHLYFVNDVADTLLPYRNNAGGGVYSAVGGGWLTKIDSSAVVNNATESTINIQAWSAGHVYYTVSAYTNGGTTPTIVYGDSTGADIHVWIERVKGGQDELHIRNDTANPETVFYKVRQAVG